MNIVLVNPPNNYDDVFELAPPLGLLTLAAAVRNDTTDVSILDFNLRGIADHPFVDKNFYAKACSEIAAKAPDVVGITSMVVNSHVALELARRLKAADPAVRIVLGGTHFSSIAEEVLRVYRWIDFVVLGEAELPFRELLRLLERGEAVRTANAPDGVAFRDGDRIVSSRKLKPFPSMDELPEPAWDLVDLQAYFDINTDCVIDYEPGRGCVYKCSFCYSPVHYGPGGQSKSIDRLLADMQHLQDLGARHLFFVQDNFLNSGRAAAELCRAIADAGFSLTWNCYATLPQMTPDVLSALGAAGCVNAFTGIDAVNEECQREYLKRFYRGWGPLEKTLRTAVDCGVTPTCAFLVENPSAGIAQVDRTLVTALFARCVGAGLRLNTLTLYNGTPTETASASPLTYSELKPQLLLDCPDLVQVNDYARDHPRLFPFHNTFLHPELWQRFVFGMHIAYTLVHSFPMTLYRWVTEDGGSIWTMIEALVDRAPELLAIDPWERRRHERELFMQWFERQPRIVRLTAETFDLESAELLLRTAPGTAEAPRFETVRTGYSVEDLHRFDLSATPHRSEAHPVMLSLGSRGIEYSTVNPPTRPQDEIVSQTAGAA